MTACPLLVDTAWLEEHLGAPGVRVLDASWYLRAEKRDRFAEFEAAHIPGARYFDIDRIADTSDPLPHMFPDAATFARMVGELGVGNADHVKRLLHWIRTWDAELANAAAREGEKAAKGDRAPTFCKAALLSGPPGARVHLGGEARVEASDYARGRLLELGSARGAATYGERAFCTYLAQEHQVCPEKPEPSPEPTPEPKS